jgi:hypothetical protein
MQSFGIRTIGLVAAGLFGLGSAQAAIIGGGLVDGSAFDQGGGFVELSAPIGNVGFNNQQSLNLFAFNELQSILLGSDLGIDIGDTGFIAAGTRISSHYVFFDPLLAERAVGYVEFDAPILGIITSTGLLAASDWLGDPSANYLSPSHRGLEAADVALVNKFLPNMLVVDLHAITPGDYLRVITAAVPEPETYALMLAGMGLIGLRLRARAQ